MGHRRLAVIDLVHGQQPMVANTANGTVCLVYSGECYNYRELREELRSCGRSFRTGSDTEVVLNGYLEWGDSVADRMNGMFAFAIWDQRDERLIMVRDRMGIKPLFYYPMEDGILFGSEPKAILANPIAERIVDSDGLREIFGFTKTPGAAIWRGMREVLPGTIVTVDQTGFRRRTYWQLAFREHTDDLATTIRRVRLLLDEIVAEQLTADVPVCALLSGGLDSSALVALAAAHLRGDSEARLRTFAVDFIAQARNFVPDGIRDTPDAPFARLVAEHVGTDHREIALDPAALADPSVRKAAVSARDLPLGRGEMDHSLYMLCAAIRPHSTVALSGEAADEVFGGYGWFHDPLVQAGTTFPWLTQEAMRRLGYVLMLEPSIADALNLGDYIEQRYREALSEIPAIETADTLDGRIRRISYLFLTRFVRMLLDRKDRLGMAVGLEIRVPYCDHRLVDYLFNVPWAFKTFDGREKSLLRAAVQEALPHSVAQRMKSPYPSTQDLGYVALLQQQADAVVHSDHPACDLFDQSRLVEVVSQDCRAVSRTERAVLEKFLEFVAWFETARPELRIE